MSFNAPAGNAADLAATHAATAPVGALAKQSSNGRSWRRPTATIHAQVIAKLQRGAATRAELEVELEAQPRVIRRFLAELLDLGVVYVSSRIQTGKTKHTELLALNAYPFQNPDAPRR